MRGGNRRSRENHKAFKTSRGGFATEVLEIGMLWMCKLGRIGLKERKKWIACRREGLEQGGGCHDGQTEAGISLQKTD